jgi:hypothetical protein
MRHTEYSVNGILPLSSNDPKQDRRNPNGIYHSIGIRAPASSSGKPLTGHTSRVRAGALGQVDGQPVVVSGSGDQAFHVPI